MTITVTDMDEAPDVTGDATKEYAENGTGSRWRRTRRWTLRGRQLSRWSLNGADASLDFSIEGGGVLTSRRRPTSRRPAEAGRYRQHTYDVTVKPPTRLGRPG